jgi:hypothetical protein
VVLYASSSSPARPVTSYVTCKRFRPNTDNQFREDSSEDPLHAEE